MHTNDLSALRDLHRERGEALRRRQPEWYSEFHWHDAELFIFDHRMTFDGMRRRLPLLAAGSEAISFEFPPIDHFAKSESGDAATASFSGRRAFEIRKEWCCDRVNYETDVWYQRNGIWKVICMHLTNLGSDPVG